ncbi:MAG: DUF5683 domain-containing protein [Bacteroidales bacterium]
MIFILLIFYVCNETIVTAQVEVKKDSVDVKGVYLTGKIKPSTNGKENAESDTVTNTVQLKSPKRASIYSAILPGLGQVYNGNYWKVPIIYSAFAGIYFLAEENNYKYHEFKEAYKNLKLGNEIDPKFDNWSAEELEQYKDYYKRNRDLNIIMGVAFYLLNILDANVDANLMDYDINPDLSLKVKPEINKYFVDQNLPGQTNFGIKFVLQMH